MQLRLTLACTLLGIAGLTSVSALADNHTGKLDRYFDNQACQLRTYVDPQLANPDYEPPNGGEDPLYYDSKTGVLLDPVSGKASVHNTTFGLTTDAKTGAKFLIGRGLWVDPKTLIPIRAKRLNNVPYYDPKTHETIDLITGDRYPYRQDLNTIGAQRTAADAIRWACLGDDLTQRIDPVTNRYLVRPDLSQIDDTLFNTYDGMPTSFKIVSFDGGRFPPPGFPQLHQYYDGIAVKAYNLNNGQSREAVMASLHNSLAPESSESGLYQTREALIENGVVVLVTATGLMDDAVSATQLLLFFDTSIPNRTRLMNAGVRQKCGRRHSSEAWKKDQC